MKKSILSAFLALFCLTGLILNCVQQKGDLVRNNPLDPNGTNYQPQGTAPVIVSQPQSQTVAIGQSVTFSVTATGTAPLSYQWYIGGTTISGATSTSYTISNVQAANAGTYTVTVSNGTLSNATSNGAVLTVSTTAVAPSITTQPQSQTITAGQSVTFNVAATGTAPLSYQWYKDGSAITGAGSVNYTISNVQAANAGTYTVTVSNGTLPNATSNGAVLTVTSTAIAPTITTQPQSQTVSAGQSVTFTVVATGTAPLSYQWYKGGTVISGAISSSYTISNVQAGNAGTYTVTVSNGALPDANSNGAVLTVNTAPAAPILVTVNAGDSSVTVTWNNVNGSTSYNLYYAVGTTVSIASGIKLTGVGSPKQVAGLTDGTKYAFAVSAVNATGESGLSNILTATPALTITDIDGNVYHTVTIGTQIWTVENLKTTKYNDGTTIPLVTANASWSPLSTPGYCWYNNDSAANNDVYGAIYNCFTVKTGKLAPIGWHVPTEAEWATLSTYLGGDSVSGGKLKEAGTVHWLSPNTGATNETGFTALPGGYRSTNGTFNYLGNTGYWWSTTVNGTTQQRNFVIQYQSAKSIQSADYPNLGFSVRCIKN